ncbi:carbohydrate ABC transporter permease [Alkalispirochaeta sphaeroplastigenens]|uniref:carbohydrate ABC transporter permease n=1 Tax=Alkalispirochaeta sphaeroplastigenens TaxID=1187066 RepID=UPI000CDA7A2D|nr:carbohydrate ABC transporter permease [Alkalispirochaeta sphaeroplastigenens]
MEKHNKAGIVLKYSDRLFISSKKIWRSKIGVWFVLFIMTLWIIIPVLWSFFSTFKTPMEIYRVPLKILPDAFSLRAYRIVLESQNFWRFTFNSVYLTVISTILTMFISIWAAYGFARMRFPLHHFLLALVLVPRLIPRISLVVPLYRMIVQMGLLNTYTALIVTYTVTSLPFAVWILSNVFQSIPREVEESALIDGASLWLLMRKIMVPMSVSGILTVVIFTVRETWNEFPFVLSFTTSADIRTLPYQLFLLRNSLGIEDWAVVNAFALLSALPILAIYFVFSKKITAGIVSGSIK